MSESKLLDGWLRTSSLVRAIAITFVGKEPKLACYIPERFRPKFARSKAEAYTPEARRMIVNSFIDVLHGKVPSV